MKLSKILTLTIITIFAFTFLTVQGCSKGKESDKAEQAQSEKKESKKGFFGQLKEIQKTVEAVKESAKKVEELENKGPVEPVHFRELLKVLPEAPSGWKNVENSLKGETARFGEYQYSTVEQRYVSEDGSVRVKVKIQDTALISPLVAMYSFASAFEKETLESYTKSIREDDKVGIREFNFKNKRGNVNLLYKDRFLVQISVNGTDKDDVLKNWEKLVNYELLSEFAEKYQTPIKKEQTQAK